MLAATTNSMPAAIMGFVRRDLGTITAIAGVESGDAAGDTFATGIQTGRFVNRHRDVCCRSRLPGSEGLSSLSKTWCREMKLLDWKVLRGENRYLGARR
jgi:hypothetical protein